MKEKKTAVITLRTTETTRKKLEIEAEERGWTISQLAEKILTSYTEQKKEEEKRINFIGNTIKEVKIN